MAPKAKKESGHRINSASPSTTGDRFVWPEWSESDINSEKWDAKKVDKSKATPSTPAYYEDPDGQPILPESLARATVEWKRIPDIYDGNGGTVIFEEGNTRSLSLLGSNSHLLSSPFSRYIIGSLQSLQDYCLESGEGLEEWRPWSLIYSLNKAGGKEHKPLVNPSGKYCVRLYWLGKWRKITIDDQIPVDNCGNTLLIRSSNCNEIWPLILSKALLKLCALSLSSKNREIPDWHCVQSLTSWVPEILNGDIDQTWTLLTRYLPIWKTPAEPPGSRQSAPNAGAHGGEQHKGGKDKKDKKGKKDEKNDQTTKNVPNRPNVFCLTELEHGEADSHPAWIVQIRDRPLSPPSPPPAIPAWKLIRPRPDVLQQLEALERNKIQDRWCHVRSALKVSHSESAGGAADNDDILSNNGATLSDTTQNVHNSVSGGNSNHGGHHHGDRSDWLRIEEVRENLLNKRCIIFHRPKSNSYKVMQENDINGNGQVNTHTKYMFTDMVNEGVEVLVSFQVQNKRNEWPPAATPPMVMSASVERPPTTGGATNTTQIINTNMESNSSVAQGAAFGGQNDNISDCQITPDPPDVGSLAHELDRKCNELQNLENDIENITGALRESTLRIQTYSFLKYLQDTTDLITCSTHSVGSVRFSLPRGRTTLRFQLPSNYGSSIILLVDNLSMGRTTAASKGGVADGTKTDGHGAGTPVGLGGSGGSLPSISGAAFHPNIHFGPLDAVLPAGAVLPYSWVEMGKELLSGVESVAKGLGNRADFLTGIFRVTKVLGSKRMWDKLRISFYKFSADVLGDKAIPEDLGALRLIFQDVVPSLGPQPYFPLVKTALNTEARELEMRESVCGQVTHTVEALTAASLIARNWRGFATRSHVDILTGNSPGARRRQEITKNRIAELYAKFDENAPSKFIIYFLNELTLDGPIDQVSGISEDSPQAYGLSSLEGKFPAVTEGWALMFRELITIDRQSLLYPILTEFHPNERNSPLKSRIRLLDESGGELGSLLSRCSPVVIEPGEYTILGEVEGQNEDTPSGSTWKLQLVSSPLCSNLFKSNQPTQFQVKSERGYYIEPSAASPEPGLLFRYFIALQSSTPVTFHLSVNNPTAKLKLVLRDGEKELAVIGREKSVLIPSLNLSPPDVELGDDGLPYSSSQASLEGPIRPAPTQPAISKVSGKARSNSRSEKNTKSGSTDNLDSLSLTLARYTIEGYCTGDWILNAAEEAWIEKLRASEANDIKVFDSDLSKKTSTSSEIVAEKSGGGGSGLSREKGNRRSQSKISSRSDENSSGNDHERATWVLRLFCDADETGDIELRPDNRRREKIRAMKLAWEAAEPGRHRKGYEARMSYLNSITPTPPIAESSSSSTISESTIEAPSPAIPNVDELMAKLKTGARGEPIEVAMERYRSDREEVLKYRDDELVKRRDDIERTKNMYEDLREREQRIFEQINFSLKLASSSPA